MKNPSLPTLAAAVSGLVLIGFTAFADPAPRLVWNGSASAPIGLYRIVFGEAQRGDLVLVRPPDTIARFAAERGYLPLGTPLVKRIAALSGDDVCVFKEAIIVNGKVVARRFEKDGAGWLLPRWNDCRQLAGAELFLLMETVPDSFDSRYFGPISAVNVIGRLVPLWTE
ncbi:MAG: conjugative transfer signal peptidase TraF [Alphaproteobacteria bacterium]|nr:conjugative transfer signal peptidase TraF [Alphaproteobacteria bacterium]